ncbi:MAG: Do family serine endopeptidase [Pirellulaceae bacterium]
MYSGWQLGPQPNQLYAQQAEVAAEIEQDVLIGADRLSVAFRNAAKVLRPSVVTITSLVERPMRSQGQIPNDLIEELLRGRVPFDPGGAPFEEEYGNDRGSSADSGRKFETGMGSGVIVSEDGYVLTNNHVVEAADELRVELSDGRTFNAKLIGTDSKSDVAVLKIEANRLMPAKLGDSSRVEVGDWVIAVGSPFGLDQTVTAGIISATNRQTNIISGGYEDFLQTDAAINPGNSGGPLVNLRGEVIGINTAINSRTGTSAGVGFAIPANMAGRIMEDLRDNGRVIRGFIGASLENVDAQNAADLKMPDGLVRGALIKSIADGQPAARANLRPGDVVTQVNGRAITSTDQLRNTVALTRPGTTLQFHIVRDGRQQVLPVKVGELTTEKLEQMSGRVEIESLGIAVQTFDPSWAQELNVERDTRGAVIVALTRSGRAAAMRLRPGDVIMQVNGTDIESAADADRLLSDAP